MTNLPHPLDQVLCIDAVLQAAQTDVTQVTLKVRKNGGAATTYTNVSTPAITQAQDAANGFHLEIAGSTYNAGDRVSHAWFYNNVQVNGCYGETIIGPAAVDGAHYTNARGDALAHLDVDVSTRFAAASWVAPDNADIVTILGDVVTMLTRVPSDIWDEVAAGHTTNGTFGKLMAFLDAPMSSRLATSDYTAPDNADIAAILADVVTLLTRIPSDIWDEAAAGHTTAGTFGRLMAFLDAAVSSRLPTSGYTAPDNADISTILADMVTLLARIPSDIWDELLASHTVSGSAGQLIARLGSGSLTLVSPTAQAGKLDLIAGDDYKSADGTAIVFTGTWPTLASVQLIIDGELTIDGTVGAGYVSFDMTATQSASLPSSRGFRVVGTLTDSTKKTIARGLCTAS